MKSNSGISVSRTSLLRTSSSRTSLLKTSWMGIFLLMLALPLPALAALGGDATSVQEDLAQMKGTLKTTEATAYTTHEITAPGKTVIKEYVSPEGKVFAIAWSGQVIPNMQQLLGTYFGRFAQAAKTQREKQLGHRPVSIQQSDFVFQNGGHMRSYVGRAYVPGMVPQGVNVDALQ
jgi:3D (Asp-Asp-Asp) domain-containing protein